MTETIVNFSDNAQKRRFLTIAGALQGPHEVTMKPWKPRRSNRQNAWYWACVVESFRQFLLAQGDNYSKDECHEILKTKCLGTVMVVNKQDGEVIAETNKSTASLKSAEFTEYADRCCAWLSEFGIVVPTPEMVGVR